MTFYLVKNLLENGSEYFVPDQQTKDANQHICCFIGGLSEAEQKAAENKAAYLEHESFRFVITKEIVNGNDTTWLGVDLQNDPEVGTYNVFNHMLGQYERKNSLSEAIARNEQLKTEFINSYNWSVETITELPPAVTYSPITYGTTVGTIPVEVM